MSPRHTSQRRAIIDAIYDAPGPLRPRDILQQASRQVPTLGMATVYRHLKRLQDAGEVQAVELGIGDVRFEPTDRGHHHHFLCRVCNGAFDIHGCPEGMDRLVPEGFKLEKHEVILSGRCRECVSS